MLRRGKFVNKKKSAFAIVKQNSAFYKKHILEEKITS